MSIAGIRSNRGDYYQKLVALDWALSVMENPQVHWIETDSTNYNVDDVVVGQSNGSLICCQCKKNQKDFKPWSIDDLSDELDKAILDLSNHPNIQIWFYSQSNFGKIAKLQEFSKTFSNEGEYNSNLTEEHKVTDSKLNERITANKSTLTTFDFLGQTVYETTPGFDRLETLLLERLRRIASNSQIAYDALWSRIDKLGSRIQSKHDSAALQHRLTKDDLRETLGQAGALLVPTIVKSDVIKSFAKTSTIGRTWVRDIAGERIPSPVTQQILEAISNKKRTILLTGDPGSGKSCVILSVQEHLEQQTKSNHNLIPLFIQSREFADFATAQERQAQGLPIHWVEQAVRLSEDSHVVVVIDSLDVLSIAREHAVLTYFLGQIDKLLLSPNITVVTACREFDRNYDRRIAIRQWDKEFKCIPLEWDPDVVPLLKKLEINFSSIDDCTRELIRNPRDLSLFVELSQHEQDVTAVTSHALAQRYLDKLVQVDPKLGNEAMKAIEALANEMLVSRTLSIPRQRFTGSHDILRRLNSLNVLQATHEGRLTFGHQTLLDVLVISGAIRSGATLNQFIGKLPPVPFIRPSVRSFVSGLITRDRRVMRNQIRTVLTGSVAFHIRRLVAETFAQHPPNAEDWPLIRELREKHREVFQVIYFHSESIEWFHFWQTYLVPVLKDTVDTDGLAAHIYQLNKWKNIAAEEVIDFWSQCLAEEWPNKARLAEQISHALVPISNENLSKVPTLLRTLLEFPIPEYTRLGQIIAQCAKSKLIPDELIWKYITCDITSDSFTKFQFDKKLRCQPHDFENTNNKFLRERMTESPALIGIALDSVEEWSRKRNNEYSKNVYLFDSNFLSDTSYEDTHSDCDHRHIDEIRELFDSIEYAVSKHAAKDSTWWRENRERLCKNQEPALLYFGIISVSLNPLKNLDIVVDLLTNQNILESELSFELENLCEVSYIYLDAKTQDRIERTLLNLWNEEESVDSQNWISHKRTRYLSTIPCHLRSIRIAEIIDQFKNEHGLILREPTIGSRGGIVTAPFSYKIFLELSDNCVIRLLQHYSGAERAFDDFRVGGEGEVGHQLSKASSMHPSRFLKFLREQWNTIPASFRDHILEGISSYLMHRNGNLQPDKDWTPIDEPETEKLATQILTELERHPTHWQRSRSLAKALEACSNVIQSTEDASRIVFLAIPFAQLSVEDTVHGDSVDLITIGINKKTGDVAEALMILASNFHENKTNLPELLVPTLLHFSSNQDPSIRALILRRLPFLQAKSPALGWELFDRATYDQIGIWKHAERCLYYTYRKDFKQVRHSLDRIFREGNGDDLETWGRISALCVLSEKIDLQELLIQLTILNKAEAWKGASSVWSHNENLRKHGTICRAGIHAGLTENIATATVVARTFNEIFDKTSPPNSIPIALVKLWFEVLERNKEEMHIHFFGFKEWLSVIAQTDPDTCLAAFEIYLEYIKSHERHFYDHHNNLVQVMTRLFAEAEEREESDSGAMLQRIVSLQDTMLSLGFSSMIEWLKSAERY